VNGRRPCGVTWGEYSGGAPKHPGTDVLPSSIRTDEVGRRMATVPEMQGSDPLPVGSRPMTVGASDDWPRDRDRARADEDPGDDVAGVRMQHRMSETIRGW